MNLLYTAKLDVRGYSKEISVCYGDVTATEDKIDVLTSSAYIGSYAPTPHTLFEALYKKGIDVSALSKSPDIDLRKPCHVWLSKEISQSSTEVSRIGCIELLDFHSKESNFLEQEQAMINSIRAYFKMLDIASVYNIKIDTVALPLLGSGAQQIPSKLLIVPLINECISFLERNPEAKRIVFINKDFDKAAFVADFLKQSSRLSQPNNSYKPEKKRMAFISYSSSDKVIADNLCGKLENCGIDVWYAPRNVHGPYAESIAKAIEKSSLFIVILSKHSLASEHVLNEIDLAFQNLPNHIKFKPLKIDNAPLPPSFKYYLSRQHWADATTPPLEDRLDEFIKNLQDESI